MSKKIPFPLTYSKENKSKERKWIERGRTMLEMMAVLVIIAILSILALVGYSLAMKTYRINETVAELKTAASAIKSGNIKLFQLIECDEDGICSDKMDTSSKEVVLNPTTYISDVEFTDVAGKAGWKTTEGQTVYAQQKRETGSDNTVTSDIFMTLNWDDTAQEDLIGLNQCSAYLNANIGYNSIRIINNGSEIIECTADNIRTNEPPCSIKELCDNLMKSRINEANEANAEL